jgi:tetratricopeptide (TPR) repeat protein
MRVLCHGIPFFCDNSPVDLYAGPHEIRTIGNYDAAFYRYDPLEETAPRVLDRISKEWPPDLMMVWMPEAHPPPLEIERAPVKTVAMVSDWNVYFPVLHVNLSRYDAVLCDTAGTEVLRNRLVQPRHLFPLYSQISPVHKPWPVEKDIDVVFVGNLDPASHATRARYLERLANLSGRYRIVITTETYREEYAKLLCRARIVFNHSIRGEVNLRVFETLACGSLAFLEEGNREIRSWLTPDEEIVLYNHENFEKKIAHYLEHPAEAEAVAARGHARAAEFAGENRLTHLVEWAALEPSSGRPFLTLPQEEQDYETLMMYGCSPFKVYHAIETRYLARVLDKMSDDPRAWTAAALHWISAHHDPSDLTLRVKRFRKATDRAMRLDPSSAVYALNGATACRHCGDEVREIECLEHALRCDAIHGKTCLIGSVADPFFIRWQRAVAEGRAHPGMIHAEAHLRLAVILARSGRAQEAERHLEQCRAADSDAAGWIRLLAEIQWATHRGNDAVSTLMDNLPRLPLDLGARDRLCQMLVESGRQDEARYLAEETMRIASAIGRFEAT